MGEETGDMPGGVGSQFLSYPASDPPQLPFIVVISRGEVGHYLNVHPPLLFALRTAVRIGAKSEIWAILP